MKKHKPRYTLMNEICASPTEPLPEFWRNTQLVNMWDGLTQLEAGAATLDDWLVCSDAVNLIETLIEQGELEDAQGLLMDAITALAEAGKRHHAGEPLRLDGTGLEAVRACLEDYGEALGLLSGRTMIRAHRLTERRLHQILSGKRRPYDVEVIGL